MNVLFKRLSVNAKHSFNTAIRSLLGFYFAMPSAILHFQDIEIFIVLAFTEIDIATRSNLIGGRES